MQSIDPGDAVKRATEAVKGLDKPYKMEAFKLILEKLMSVGDENRVGATTTDLQSEKAPGRRKRPSRKPSKVVRVHQQTKPRPVTKLSLSVVQLEELKSYFSRFSIKGGEYCAFLIANFLTSELEMKSFNAADVEYCYRQLISMKTTVPEIKDIDRALNWLTAPSRKKEWLRRNNDQYELTNSGLIAFNHLEHVALNGDSRKGQAK